MTEMMTPEVLAGLAMIIAVAACCLVEWLTPRRPAMHSPSFAGLTAAAPPKRRGWTIRRWRDNTPWAGRSVRCGRIHAAHSAMLSPFFRPAAGKYAFAMIELNSHGQKLRRLDGVENCGAADGCCAACGDDIWADDPGWIAGPAGTGFLCQFHTYYRKLWPAGPPMMVRAGTPPDLPRAADVERLPLYGAKRFAFDKAEEVLSGGK